LSQAKLALKADKLKKFINAGGPQMQWLFDVGRTNFRITSGIEIRGAGNPGMVSWSRLHLPRFLSDDKACFTL